MATFPASTYNLAADAITIDLMSLHSGDPGTTGANYISDAGRVACSFAAADDGERVLSADVEFSGMTPSQSVTNFGVWLDEGTVFLGGGALTGDQAANAAGEYTVKAATTKLTVAAAS